MPLSDEQKQQIVKGFCGMPQGAIQAILQRPTGDQALFAFQVGAMTMLAALGAQVSLDPPGPRAPAPFTPPADQE